MTKELNSLEFLYRGNPRDGDDSHAASEALSVLLERSRETLKHTRFLGFDYLASGRVPLVDYCLFSGLKVICLGWSGLHNFHPRFEKRLPSSLNLIYFPWYIFDDAKPGPSNFQEKLDLINLLTSNDLPNLKTVAVPKHCWTHMYKETVSPRSKHIWGERRKALQGLEIFTSGKALLRLLEPREIRE